MNPTTQERNHRWTGLSEKELGPSEYHRRYRALLPPRINKRRWTGLSDKQLGHAEYMRLWRELRAQVKGLVSTTAPRTLRDAIDAAKGDKP